jgi:hypothetical protein
MHSQPMRAAVPEASLIDFEMNMSLTSVIRRDNSMKVKYLRRECDGGMRGDAIERGKIDENRMVPFFHFRKRSTVGGKLPYIAYTYSGKRHQ